MSPSVDLTWRALSWAVLVFLAPGPRAAAEPLPAPASPAASPATLVSLAAAEGALSTGLPGVAALQYEKVLRSAGLSREMIREATLGLASARLSEGRWSEAEAILSQLPETEPRVRLRLLLARLHQPGAENLRSQLASFTSAGLPAPDLPWWHLVKGLSRELENDPTGRDASFREAERLAGNEEQRAQFQLLLYRSQIRRGPTLTAERLDQLREQKDRQRGRPEGFGFAKIFAIELNRAGKTAEAVVVLEDAVGLASSVENGARGDLRLLLALVQGPEKTSGQKALDDILKDQNLSPATQRLALNLLVSVIGTDGGNEKIKKDLRDRLGDRWGTPTGAHPLADEIRERLSFIHLQDREPAEAEKILSAWEKSVRDRLGASFEKSESRIPLLRQSTLIAWQRASTLPVSEKSEREAQFKAAALGLGELRGLTEAKVEKARLSLLQGDALFQGRQFSAAAAAYVEAWNDSQSAGTAELQGTSYRQRIQALLEAARLASESARKAEEEGRLGESETLRQERSTRMAEAASWADRQGPLCPDLSARWQSEWNLVQLLRSFGRAPEALARVTLLAQSTPPSFPPELKARLLWLQAELSLEGPASANIPGLLASLRELVAANPLVFKEGRDDLLARSTLLEGRALLTPAATPEAVSQALELFRALRASFPGKDPASDPRGKDSAAQSLLVEARFLANQNRHLEAEAAVNALRDDYPESPYTPVALYEAAILRERRGLAGQAEPGSGGGIFEGAALRLNQGLSTGQPQPPEDPQHPRVLLRELVGKYPEHPLTFYALLKLANYARSNASFEDYSDADKLCDQILKDKNFATHSEIYRAEMTKADCQFALGGGDPLRYAEAFSRYERLHDNASLPDDVRIEAGCKMVETARARGDRAAALRLAEVVLQNLELQEPLRIEARTLGVTGRYWLSRTLFFQAAQLEAGGKFSEAQRAYERIQRLNLPGSPLANDLLARLRQPVKTTTVVPGNEPGK